MDFKKKLGNTKLIILGTEYKEKNNYGLYEEKRKYEKSYNGTTIVKEKNQYGLWETVGEIK